MPLGILCRLLLKEKAKMIGVFPSIGSRTLGSIDLICSMIRGWGEGPEGVPGCSPECAANGSYLTKPGCRA